MEASATEERLRRLRGLIGNTPLLAIDCTYAGEQRTIYAKAEHLNLTGSIKDRIAFHIIEEAYAKGFLEPGDRIIEANGGHTDVAFAAIGQALGHPVTIFMPDWMSIERVNLIRGLGAEIVLVSKQEGGFLGSIEKAEALAAESENTFLPRQFLSIANVEVHYLTTGPEIWGQLQFRSLLPDAFVAGVGTGGTIMGTGAFLRSRHPATRLHPLELASSPALSSCRNAADHRIQGVTDEFVPRSLPGFSGLDAVVHVGTGDAILMAQKLSEQLGLDVGVSSGANFIGALKAQNELGPDSIVVTVFSDGNENCLSADVLHTEPVHEHDLSPDVELLSFRALKRIGHACCNSGGCAAADGGKTGHPLHSCPRQP